MIPSARRDQRQGRAAQTIQEHDDRARQGLSTLP
jgi:hypothetical protein